MEIRDIKAEAKSFIAMLKTYAAYKKYNTAWVAKVYQDKYPTKPLTEEEFQKSGSKEPTEEFLDWINQYTELALKKQGPEDNG